MPVGRRDAPVLAQKRRASGLVAQSSVGDFRRIHAIIDEDALEI
jgi:hypothetical protein